MDHDHPASDAKHQALHRLIDVMNEADLSTWGDQWKLLCEFVDVMGEAIMRGEGVKVMPLLLADLSAGLIHIADELLAEEAARRN